MNKRGQFYLIAAIIIIAIIASLIIKVNSVKTKPQPQAFSEISENFEKEAIKIIDAGVQQDKDFDSIKKDLHNFAETYSSYTSTKSPQTGFLYVFGNATNISVVNFLVTGAEVEMKGSNSTIIGGNVLTLHKLTLEVGKEKFVRDLQVRAKEFKGINLASGQGNFVKINIGGIPYTIAITELVSFEALTIHCNDETQECYVKIN
ncbi:hypothetical protein B6U80_02560 [Candidatus Pacearchaeota archaeon ex4484_26]|nr:MAG: hypothetical protein B6U80_02560 [Candidatus Pacearchaeota archaeon ex4484_26]